MTFKIEKDTKVWDSIKSQAKILNNFETEVGWFPENRYGSDNENLQMAQVAQWNNEGHALQGVPPRPFLSVGFPRALRLNIQKDVFKDVIRAISEGSGALVRIKRTEQELENVLRKVMIDWNDPPNSIWTIEAKGFNDPLINTSQLVANVTAKTHKKGEY